LYTLRWHVRQQTPEGSREALEILAEILGESAPTPAPAVAPAQFSAQGAGLLRVPFAIPHAKESRTKGKYEKGYPIGAVVHFTAGRDVQRVSDALDYQVQQGYTYFFIDKEGNIGQNFPLDEWGNHAGESKWPGIGKSVSRHLVGIEIACAGLLDKNGKAWFGQTIPEEQRRKVPGLDNMQEGLYQKYTPAQEASLIKLLVWLKLNKPNTFNCDYILGHDEVSGVKGIGWNRKNDPGGALSMTMSKLRETIKSQVK
jgi:N-acetyl-anhydromuramyl-L-alanine amidase AmpD